MSNNFLSQCESLIRAEVRMISGCDDDQTSADVSNVSSINKLPNPAGKPGGACTSALLDVLYSGGHNQSFQSVLLQLREKIWNQGFSQVPQLSSSRPLELGETPFHLSKGLGQKRALLVGINYVGQDGELSGCFNDVRNMKRYIQDIHGFSEQNIEVLMDDGKHKIPSRRNIILSLQRLVSLSKGGDDVFFHYSGHGGILSPDMNTFKNQNNCFDETLIPVDHDTNGQIRDFNLFRHFVQPMEKDVTVTCLMDCCHSGSVLDLPYTFRADSSSSRMVKNMDYLGNLAFMYTLAGGALTFLFADVIGHIENSIEGNLDNYQGLAIEDSNQDFYETDEFENGDRFMEDDDQYGYNTSNPAENDAYDNNPEYYGEDDIPVVQGNEFSNQQNDVSTADFDDNPNFTSENYDNQYDYNTSNPTENGAYDDNPEYYDEDDIPVVRENEFSNQQNDINTADFDDNPNFTSENYDNQEEPSGETDGFGAGCCNILEQIFQEDEEDEE